MTDATCDQRLLAHPLDQASEDLMMFDSYSRTEAMVKVMLSTREAADRIRVFQEWGNMCDAPWPFRSILADILRRACSKIDLAEVLSPEARSFFDALPDLASVLRGCEQGRERGLHWTTSRGNSREICQWTALYQSTAYTRHRPDTEATYIRGLR